MRKGSALLIVLGMLSFMVVSAVGFSVYMRQSRVPSSYLRRNISARYLVKAALANAIEELEGGYNEDLNWGMRDNGAGGMGSNSGGNLNLNQNHFYGIYDDPFPGCGPDNQFASGDVKKNGDFWYKRVFCPFGPVSEPENENEALREENLNPTVPTLTLEALAYLPPAIADDVRKVSRLTRTACWRPLPYDAGRYAYAAVNVSDFFDINRLQVAPRDSGAGRISLASLGATDAGSVIGGNGGNSAGLKTAVEKWEQASPSTPYVSLADFALLNAGSAYSPFSKFIGGTSSPLLSGSSSEEANSIFVTDTWFPVTPSVAGGGVPGQQQNQGKVYDLAGGHQPFSQFNADEITKIDQMENTTDNAGKIFEKNLGNGLACLYDYLDSDSLPISLAFPTTEAVPMVVAVGAPEHLQMVINPSSTDKTEERTLQGKYVYDVKRTVKTYGISSFSPSKAVVNVSVMYPFKRMRQTGRNTLETFKVRGVMRVFAVPVGTDFNGRPTRPAVDALRPDSTALFNSGAKSYGSGVATFASERVDVSFTDDNLKQNDHQWIKDVQLMFDTDGMNIPVLNRVEETWTLKRNDDPEGSSAPQPTPQPMNTLDGLSASGGGGGGLGSNIGVNGSIGIFCPIQANGALANGAAWVGGANLASTTVFEPGSSGENTLDNVTAFSHSGEKFQLYAAVWVQVTDSSGNKVFDMVPASAADDELWLGTSGQAPSSIIPEGTSLLDFVTDYGAGAGFAIDENLQQTFASEATYSARTALFAVDPRYNFAPENWFYRKDGNTDLSAKWISAMGADNTSGEVFGRAGRDRDVFMFVSDQEYLQDIGELQFLPALYADIGPDAAGGFVTGNIGYGAGMRCNGRAYADGSGGITEGMLQNNDGFADGTYFWRTYTAYDNGDGTDPIYALGYTGYPNGIRFHSGAGGFRLNPYSSDNRVLAAAFGGTPFDYYVASTNDQQRQAGGHQNSCATEIRDMDYGAMVTKYAFGSSCPQAQLSDDTLADFLDVVKTKFSGIANAGRTDWLSAWNELMWQDANTSKVGDANDTFFADDINPEGILHGVDRKFLYSYWRECFDNRQQLFLIFVRAEPSAVGGGASGSLSSAQLGGRAVALVWRDPEIPQYNRLQRTTTYKRDQLRDSGDNIKRRFRDMKKDTPTHQTRILFYHQFD